jgi:hypothetical protein
MESERARANRLRYLKEWRAKHPGYQNTPERRAYAREWMRKQRERDPEGARRTTQKYRLKTKYGLALEDYDRLFVEQDGLCAICHRPETMKIKGTVCSLAVDHDGKTGRVRGLLCVNCNMLIGGAGHDPAILEAAIAYLNRV